ncbi:helix-turn-helix domain-containing protein [Rhodococcus sp. 05-2255-3B1]
MSDRLKKALAHSDVSVTEMADYLGVTRETISRWINGRTKIGKAPLRLWALRTGVRLAWIEHGTAVAESPRPDGDPNGGSSLPHLDSNQEPFD